MNNSALELTGLAKSFDGAAAVDGVDLSVPTGSFLVLLGPSGCGKTTTLRMLAGLEAPTGGTISFGGQTVASGRDGVAVPPGRRSVGLVFQSYALWPHMSVRANIEWPLKVAKWPVDERKSRVEEVLNLLAISTLGDRYPGEISGGQQQRVAIARTIAPKPEVLLFDEPLSNLDAKLRVETRAELMRIHRATQATSVYVTHDQVEAMTMATHIALMKDGRIEQFGTPAELLENPATAFVATFIGTPAANILPATVVSGRLLRDQVDFGETSAVNGAAVQVMYRADSLVLAPGASDRTIRMELSELTPMAGRWVVTGLSGSERLSVIVDSVPKARLGEVLWVQIPEIPDAVFDENGRLLAMEPAAELMRKGSS